MFTTVIAGVCGGAGDEDVRALAQLLAATPESVIEVQVPHGAAVARGLHDAATQHDAGLIVVGSSRRGLVGRIFAGDDAVDTLRSAPCAVAVAPKGYARAVHPIDCIGVGYDGSDHAQVALDTARALAQHNGATVRALGVATPPQRLTIPIGISAIAELGANRDRTEQCIADLGPGIVAHAVDGVAHQRLTELAAQVDLLIVGSCRHGRGGRAHAGSTSETLSREAACPLLVVAAPRPDRSAAAA